jgi:hypothetical protein
LLSTVAKVALITSAEVAASASVTPRGGHADDGSA